MPINTNNWSFNGINTTAQGGSIFGSNTDASNGFAGIEGSTQGTGSGIKGMHMATTGAGIGVHGTTASTAAGWAGFFEGDVGITGILYGGSDIRWKKNIEPMNGVLDKIMNLQVKTYEMRANEFPGMGFKADETKFGFIAQDLKLVFPEIVRQKAIPDPLASNESRHAKTMSEGYHTVDYISLIPVLTKAIQEQQIQITDLQEQLDHKANIDLSNLTLYRIIASSNARLDADDLFIADENSKAYVIGVLEANGNGSSVIQTSGIVEIEVDNANGQIMAGDFVTTSNLGKAIKSENNEWVIGVAVSNEIDGLVQVRIDIRFKQ